MLNKCACMPPRPSEFNLDKFTPESISVDNASQIKGSIIPISSKASIKKKKKFEDIPYERLITIAELL